MGRYAPKAGSRSERFAYKQKQLNSRYPSHKRTHSKSKGSKRNTGCLGCAGCMIPTVLGTVLLFAFIICMLILL